MVLSGSIVSTNHSKGLHEHAYIQHQAHEAHETCSLSGWICLLPEGYDLRPSMSMRDRLKMKSYVLDLAQPEAYAKRGLEGISCTNDHERTCPTVISTSSWLACSKSSRLSAKPHIRRISSEDVRNLPDLSWNLGHAVRDNIRERGTRTHLAVVQKPMLSLSTSPGTFAWGKSSRRQRYG